MPVYYKIKHQRGHIPCDIGEIRAALELLEIPVLQHKTTNKGYVPQNFYFKTEKEIPPEKQKEIQELLKDYGNFGISEVDTVVSL